MEGNGETKHPGFQKLKPDEAYEDFPIPVVEFGSGGDEGKKQTKGPLHSSALRGYAIRQ
jgi:hypothetical protein